MKTIKINKEKINALKTKTELTNEEKKSQFIFEELEMGCWHKYERVAIKQIIEYNYRCGKCGILSTQDDNPNFFESDADCREMLGKIPDFELANGLLDFFGYGEITRATLFQTDTESVTMQTVKIKELLRVIGRLAKTSTAQKAEAIYRTLREKEKK